jgi:hypothetical protein
MDGVCSRDTRPMSTRRRVIRREQSQGGRSIEDSAEARRSLSNHYMLLPFLPIQLRVVDHDLINPDLPPLFGSSQDLDPMNGRSGS